MMKTQTITPRSMKMATWPVASELGAIDGKTESMVNHYLTVEYGDQPHDPVKSAKSVKDDPTNGPRHTGGFCSTLEAIRMAALYYIPIPGKFHAQICCWCPVLYHSVGPIN